jgi:prevent-host-death family protein
MVMRNISEAKAELSALIEAVQKGSEVIIAKAGKPVARLVPFRGPARPRTPGSMAGKIWIAPDFDALPDDIAEAFGMKEPRSLGSCSIRTSCSGGWRLARRCLWKPGR